MPFDAVFELSDLDGSNGFRINGEAAGDYSGNTVASAGDVNGDGFDDLIIGAPRVAVNGMNSGASYVVFGRASGFPSSLDLSTLDGTNGFKINGQAASDFSGLSVASAGDVNGDGYDDVIIGARTADSNGSDAGASYVVFGKASGFSADLELSALNGANGFKISGVAALDISGCSVASAGDINGDGYDDLIIGAFGADPHGSSSGASYVVFGKALGYAANLNLSSLNGTNGFMISGEIAGDQSGGAVASAGDVNGDGYADLIIGAEYADPIGAPPGTDSGASYVVFGKASGFGANLDLSTLDGSNGFQINGNFGDRSGKNVASAGDINGDGYDDLIIGAYLADPNGTNSGASYVVFGKASGFTANLSLPSLDGTNGFRINGEFAHDHSGISVASAGDINNDGYDDLIVGARGADPNGSGSGASYLIYGRASGFSASLNLATLDGSNGVRINGVAASDSSGSSVASAGDVNADGYDDVIVGARGADPNGAQSGSSYIVFGGPTPVSFAGTPGNDSSTGGAGADSLSGLGGNDILSGLGGDDTLDGGDLSDQLFGGDGADTLLGGGGGDLLYGDAGNDTLDGGDGADKLFGGTGADLLIGSTGNDRMLGEGDVDTLEGQDGNDYLDGGAGADLMSGGFGNDVYIVDNVGDQTTEDAAQGFDVVRSSLTWTLGANLEALELQGGGNINGYGNSGSNNIQGNMGDNILEGGAGVDTLNGGDGDDVIVGGAGNDLMRGGIGQDTFDIDTINLAGPLETDQIYDFSTAEGDVMDFGNIDANIHTVQDESFTLVAAFTKTAGQMTAVFAGGVTTVRLDVNGDGRADYQVKINGDVSGDTGDWFL